MRLYFFLVLQRVPPVPSHVLLEVFDLLRRRGFTVEAGVAERGPQPAESRAPAAAGSA
jgi:hypothetical protein